MKFSNSGNWEFIGQPNIQSHIFWIWERKLVSRLFTNKTGKLCICLSQDILQSTFPAITAASRLGYFSCRVSLHLAPSIYQSNLTRFSVFAEEQNSHSCYVTLNFSKTFFSWNGLFLVFVMESEAFTKEAPFTLTLRYTCVFSYQVILIRKHPLDFM